MNNEKNIRTKEEKIEWNKLYETMYKWEVSNECRWLCKMFWIGCYYLASYFLFIMLYLCWGDNIWKINF